MGKLVGIQPFHASIPNTGGRDTYHHPAAYIAENLTPRSCILARRGVDRYDPVSREYVEWGHPEDWNNHGIGNHGRLAVPRFTEKERHQMCSYVVRGRLPDPAKMGDDWNNMGPKVLGAYRITLIATNTL